MYMSGHYVHFTTSTIERVPHFQRILKVEEMCEYMQHHTHCVYIVYTHACMQACFCQ